jgi:hypothetical protein
MPKIVLTGGGHGGKTRFASEYFTGVVSGVRCITIPELADTAFSCGLNPKEKEFELFVYSIQKATEDTACLYASGAVTLCHRGTLDCLAFWLRKGWSQREFLTQLGTSLETEYRRYAGVIHLETTAAGAEAVYSNQVSSRPVESLEQARRLDELCATVWKNHPHYIHISNRDKGWHAKSSETFAAVDEILALGRMENTSS